MCIGFILSNFFWYHAEYHSGAWWPTVSFLKVLDQDGLWSKKKWTQWFEKQPMFALRAESKERRQEPLRTYLFG